MTRKFKELTEKDFNNMDKKVLIDIALLKWRSIQKAGYFIIKEVRKK